MRTVEYTKSFVAKNSSVIDKVFYAGDTRELFVHLHNGTKVGYRAVPPSVYDQFEAYNVPGGSVGAYWNHWIKDKVYYPGISGDVTLVEKGSTRNQFVNVNAPAAVAGDPEFTVTVEVSGLLTFTGTAKDGTDALRKVNEALNETFVGKSKIKELTQKFD